MAEAFAALSPAEQDAAREHRRQRREESAQRKAEKLALARRVFALNDDGRTAAEIGEACGGRSAFWVHRFAASRGIVISPLTKSVRRAVRLTLADEAALQRLAHDGKMTPTRALADLVTIALEADALIARRTLSVTRRPA